MDKSFKLRPSRCRLLTDGNGWRDLHQMFSSYPYRCLANPSALSPHFFQALKIFRPIASNFSIAARLSNALTPQCRCPARRRR
ncbi:hypothetical protein B0H10DRAFT_2435818, partial [Mycena sp. CBHHK59/15]